MTDLAVICEDDQFTCTIDIVGDDLHSLLYNFLDELLFRFSTRPFFVARRIVVERLDMEALELTATCYGESFDLKKHECRTEVKAITKSNMQVSTDPPCDIYVIFDI